MKILMGCGLLLWLGVALAQAAPLAGHELQLALQQLEESAMPVQVFRERVAALVAGQAHYPPEVQGRLARLQCWALPGERDEEFRRAVAFAEQGLAQSTGSPKWGCSPAAGITGNCSATWPGPGRITTPP